VARVFDARRSGVRRDPTLRVDDRDLSREREVVLRNERGERVLR